MYLNFVVLICAVFAAFSPSEGKNIVCCAEIDSSGECIRREITSASNADFQCPQFFYKGPW